MVLDEVCGDLVRLLFPHLVGVRVKAVAATPALVRFDLHAVSATASCTGCGDLSGRVHSRYVRTVSETGFGGREVCLRILVRRFRCESEGCARRVFCEQVPGVTERYQRRTPLLRELLTCVGLALGGRAGARMARAACAGVSRTVLLSLLRRLPDGVPVPVDGLTAVGVDDFAFARGHRYGTVLVDLVSGRPVYILPERTASTVADWLARHPGIRVLCRDRAGAYAEAAARGAPQAVQVADRWHLWHNLGEAVEKAVARHRAALPATLPALPSAEAPRSPHQSVPPAASHGNRTDRTAERTRDRFGAVHGLLEQGMGIRTIAAELRLSRGTVRRFARARTPEELLVLDGTGRRPGILDPYKPYLRQMFADGATNAARLTAEITARGYTGGATTVRVYIGSLRLAGPQAPSPARKQATVRQATAWILTDPQTLTPDDTERLEAALAASPALADLAEHVRAFAKMVRNLTGQDRLRDWIGTARHSGIPSLASFAAGLERDYDAVQAGLSLPYSSGSVEGHVNRIKMLKRQMYGRANLDLLRIRVLHAA